MRRRAQGRRPVHFTEPVTGPLLTISLTLAQELSTVRERLDTVERLLVSGQVPSAAAIDAYRPDATAAAEREALRDDLVRRVLRVVSEDLARGQFPREPVTAEQGAR